MFNLTKFIALAIATLFSANLMAQYDQAQLKKTMGNDDQLIIGINLKAANSLEDKQNIHLQMYKEDTMLKKICDIATKEGLSKDKVHYVYMGMGNEGKSFSSRVQTDVKAQQVANFINALAKEIDLFQTPDKKPLFSVVKTKDVFAFKIGQEENKENNHLTFKDDEKGYLSFVSGTRTPMKKNAKSPLLKLIPKDVKDLLIWGAFTNSAFKETVDTAALNGSMNAMVECNDAVKTILFTTKKDKDNYILKIVAATRNAQSAKTMKTQIEGQLMMIDVMLMNEPEFAALIKKAISIESKKANLEVTITFTPKLIEAFTTFINKVKAEAASSQNIGNFELDDLDDSIEIDVEETSDDK